ncbi:MAG: Txe/YoeB family addiction module toxin [Bacteroidales bacterium]|jgi:toxin YoeB|nr:Txe/YoeB family addiction module toxin [Bacteroidales bacterium]
MYDVRYQKEALDDLAKLKRQEPTAFRKAVKLIDELYEHPKTGTGKPEPLSGDRVGQWSRRITKKHRLVYEIRDMEVIVIVISAYGHYEDK